MKKNEKNPFLIYLFSMTAFTVMSVLVIFLKDDFVTIASLFFFIVAFLVLFNFQRKCYQKTEIEQIQYVNHQAEDSLSTLLERMPVGVIKLNMDSIEIEWFNPYAELILTTEDGEIDISQVQEIIKASISSPGVYANIGEKRYAVHLDRNSGVLYFFDVSGEYEATVELATSRPVIGVISVDNYDDLENETSESDISQINSFVANFVEEFTRQHKMFSRRVGMDRFYLFTDYIVLEHLMKDKFSVIDTFREEAKQRNLPLTISMGLSYGDGDHESIGKVALSNLNLAEVRGGDQVVVRENDETKKPVYFGGGSVASVKRTRTRTRAMMTAISEKLKSVDRVFIVGHKNLDMDALGSAVGMQLFSSNVMDESYVVYDAEQMSPDIHRAIQFLENEGVTKLIYIESGASSASELVTELIQFQNSKKIRLSRIQASLLMGGIMLDTKNFTSRVTSRTFDVASYLRTRGSDSVVIQDISATDFEEYRLVNELILQGQMVQPSILVAQALENKEYDTVVISKAADAMLAMSGIEASFVVARNLQGDISISARSRSKINVQRIMEELGGGGHFNLAAARLSDMTLQEAGDKLKIVISNDITDKETEE